jgi:tetratricopeptide (TPR) repeat protein
VAWARARLDPDRLWDQAQAALRAGRPEQAEAKLVWIRRLRSPSSLDWMLEAQVASAHGRAERALAALSHVPDDDPLAAQAFLLAGRLERERNRVRAAEAEFRRALKVDPDLIDAHKELIHIYGVQLRRKEVDAEFRALARRTRLTHHDLFTWLLTHFTSWRPDIARDLQAYVDADPGDRYSRLALAEILLDQPGQAERVVQILDALPASDADALALRVGLALHLGRLDEADALLARGPNDHPGLARFRGRLALRRNDPAAAAEHLRRALSSEPYDRVSPFDLGQALALKGDKQAAEALLDRARRLNALYELVIRVRSPDRENQPSDLTRLASACEAAGLMEEARHWYALAISRDPLDCRAQAALFRLAQPKKDE